MNVKLLNYLEQLKISYKEQYGFHKFDAFNLIIDIQVNQDNKEKCDLLSPTFSLIFKMMNCF